MKTFIHYIVAFLAIIPGLLIFNNSEAIWPNFAGIAYIILIWLVTTKTKTGRRVFLSIYRTLGR